MLRNLITCLGSSSQGDLLFVPCKSNYLFQSLSQFSTENLVSQIRLIHIALRSLVIQNHQSQFMLIFLGIFKSIPQSQSTTSFNDGMPRRHLITRDIRGSIF